MVAIFLAMKFLAREQEIAANFKHSSSRYKADHTHKTREEKVGSECKRACMKSLSLSQCVHEHQKEIKRKVARCNINKQTSLTHVGSL
jgi:hypothetical protein